MTTEPEGTRAERAGRMSLITPSSTMTVVPGFGGPPLPSIRVTDVIAMGGRGVSLAPAVTNGVKAAMSRNVRSIGESTLFFTVAWPPDVPGKLRAALRLLAIAVLLLVAAPCQTGKFARGKGPLFGTGSTRS
jgi:hypothetical protein